MDNNWAKIDEVITRGYRKVADIEGGDAEEVFHSSCCEFLIEEMQPELIYLGINTQSVNYEGSDIAQNHKFMIVEMRKKWWVVDPTWQQFLDKPDYSKPKIMKVEISELERGLKELGIPENKWRIWRNGLL